jgi:hypothetical protein
VARHVALIDEYREIVGTEDVLVVDGKPGGLKVEGAGSQIGEMKMYAVQFTTLRSCPFGKCTADPPAVHGRRDTHL